MVPLWFQNIFVAFTGFIFKVIPQSLPTKKQVNDLKIIAHRGVFNNKNVLENTEQAFQKALDLGAFGVELDIHWTKDLEVVVSHDPTFKRLFNDNRNISDLTWKEVQTAFPKMTSLNQVVEKFGKKLHLFIELKAEDYLYPTRQAEKIKDIFSELTPAVDFHFLSYEIKLFKIFNFFPSNTFFPIFLTDAREASKAALQNNLAGLTGHFLLFDQKTIAKHRKKNQLIGTGIINNKNTLWREAKRGVTFIVTDQTALIVEAIANYHKNCNE